MSSERLGFGDYEQTTARKRTNWPRMHRHLRPLDIVGVIATSYCSSFIGRIDKIHWDTDPVWIYAGGRNVSLEMVRLEQAYAYREYLRGCDENAYLNAESQAQRTR